MRNLETLYREDGAFRVDAIKHAADYIGTTSLTFAEEWLESAIGSEMRQSTPEERAEYERMLAKYSTNVGVNIFDLERQTEIPDSREKLEDDVREAINGFLRKHNGAISWNDELVVMAKEWLDRQTAITEHECALRWQHIAEDRDRAEIERDNLADDLLACNREREHLRMHLGIALDHAHDILALVDLDGEVVS